MSPLGFAACQSKKGNSLIIRLLPLQGVGLVWRIFTQGVALGYVLLPLRGVLLVSFDTPSTFLPIFLETFSSGGGRNPIGRRTESDRTADGIRSDGGRNPIGRRTESDRTADANGGTRRGCTCLRSALPLARARSAPTKHMNAVCFVEGVSKLSYS